MASRGQVLSVGVLVGALALSGCAADLPPSVVEGSTVSVGWSGSVTSLNAATRDGATRANREVASATRARFARVSGGEVVPDESFGSVEVTDTAAASFTVRYDLAEPRWSDGTPLDAADLLLAWAAGSGALADAPFDPVPTALAYSEELPEVDEFERSIDVTFTRPVRDWHTAVDVAVPAHVVGEIALGIEDPMEAKQAVITAIREGEGKELTAIASAWSDGFDLEEGEEIPEELLVASGPYRLESLEPDPQEGDRVSLAVNREYAGGPPPSYEHVELTSEEPLEQLAEIGEGLDVAQFEPTAENRELIRDLERRDHHVSTSGDGETWALVLAPGRGPFTSREARLAFLRAIPRSDVVSAGAGPWREAYSGTDSLLTDPGAKGYSVAVEDSGFRTTYAESTTDAAFERQRAGVSAGTPVCVRYDVDEPFAAEAFGALQSEMAEEETGWQVEDCGAKGADEDPTESTDWHAVLTRVSVPESAHDLRAQWGSGGDPLLRGEAPKKRDPLIDKVAGTADPYDAADAKMALEAHLLDEAIALPLAVDPVVTVSARGVENVRVDGGAASTVLATVGEWGPDE